MKRMKFLSALTVLGLLAAMDAGAQLAPANTGATGNVVAGVDTRWQFSTDGGLTWRSAFQVQGPPSPPWEPNTPQYSWISETVNGTGGSGNYLFRTLFDLTGYDPASTSLSFNCVVDNERPFGGGYFSLNGSAYGGTCGSGGTTGFRFAGTQTLSSGFTGGVNELRFNFVGDRITDGMLVGNMSLSTVSAVPEPASLALLATGLVGMFGVIRLRRDGNRS